MIHHVFKALFQHGAKHATKAVVQQAMVPHAAKAAVVVATPWMSGARVRKHAMGFLAKVSHWGLRLFKRS
jgi:hypothetical protein